MTYENQESRLTTDFNPDARAVDFLSASQNDDPSLYPGQRPESSYVTDGTNIFNIEVDTEGGEINLKLNTADGRSVDIDEFLQSRGVPLMDDRIPVLAFGANVSPGSLASKFKKVGREDALVIPTVYCELSGHDVVWSGGPGMKGNFIAIMYEGEETANTTVQVAINFLTREQMVVMHATELNYQLASKDVSVEGVDLRTFFYVGQDSIYLEDGRPVAISSINAEGRNLPEDSTGSLLDKMLRDEQVSSALYEEFPGIDLGGVDSYMAHVELLAETKGARTDFKKAIHRIIGDLNLSKMSSNPSAELLQESWANPSTLPSFGDMKKGIYHHELLKLASQELGEWPDKEARRKVIGSIATHYRRHKED